jgi:crossover junction endodeoxyribonuclease RuvC
MRVGFSLGFGVGGMLGTMATDSHTILGIDPGLQSTGFGVVQVNQGKLAYVASGTVRTLEVPRGDLPARLRLIFEGVREVVSTYKPDMVAMEIVFVNVNPQSTLLLGQARGAAMAALFAGVDHPAVAEYTALQMKKAVVGHGHATKAQIGFMVTRLLNLSREPQNDAADALGLAICHAHAHPALSKMAQVTSLSRRAHAQIKDGRVY